MKTSLSQTYPWGLFRRSGHRLLCADGVIRAAELAQCADTYFSIAASIRIRGKRISGYATTDEVDGVRVYTFRPHVWHKPEHPALAWPACYTEENASILKKAL
jgi:hypothetical protein